VLVEFEHGLIRERTAAGLRPTAQRGRKAGRGPVLTPVKLAGAKLVVDQALTAREAS